MIVRAYIAVIAAFVSLGTAHAASVTETQAFGCGGDFAEGVFCNAVLPPFNTSLGNLIGVKDAVTATERWYENINVNEPSHTSSMFPIEAWLTVLGTEITTQFNAAPRTWTVRHSVGQFSETVLLHGGFIDDPALYLAPLAPEIATVSPYGAVNIAGCMGYCSIGVSGDSQGIVNGLIATTFTYQPTNFVPEPYSVALLAVGCVTVLRFGSRRRRA